jgi:hypothetical protein
MSYNAGIEVFAADAYQSWINDYSETSPNDANTVTCEFTIREAGSL